MVGAVSASLLTADPAVGLAAGVASHFLLDMIPHYDYELASKREPDRDGVKHKTMVFGRSFLIDCVKMSLDLSLGVAVVFVISLYAPGHTLVLLSGLVGGVLPDALQFCYFQAPKVFGWLQMFHEWIHSRYEIIHPLDGAFAQLLVVVAVLTIWVGLVN